MKHNPNSKFHPPAGGPNSNSGLAALIIVVLICSAAFIMAYSASILGLGGLENAYTYQQGAEVAAFTEGCAENALYHLKLDAGYLGGVLPLTAGSCIIEITDLGGGQRDLQVTGAMGDYSHKLHIVVLLSGGDISILEWETVNL